LPDIDQHMTFLNTGRTTIWDDEVSAALRADQQSSPLGRRERRHRLRFRQLLDERDKERNYA
jgi:hypothetical protein